jgi:SPP1 gp7 family putative phage head morphogenesis protein
MATKEEIKKVVLSELLFLTKRLRVLPIRRDKRRQSELTRSDLAVYFRVLSQRIPAERLASEAQSRISKDAESDAVDTVVREWVEVEGVALTKHFETLLSRRAVGAFQAAQTRYAEIMRIGFSFNLDRPAAEAFLRTRGAERVKGILGTTRKQMADVLADGIRDGKSTWQIGKDLRAKVLDMSKARAENIAVTETSFAYGAAQEKLAEATGAQGKRWLTAKDDKVCEYCLANQADGVIPVGQAFSAGAMWEPQHAGGCRCTTLLENLPQ